MKTLSIPIEIPEDIFVALNKSESELKNSFQVAVALMLFQQDKLTLGKAIQLSGLSRFEFEKTLFDNNISLYGQNLEEVFADADKLKNLK